MKHTRIFLALIASSLVTQALAVDIPQYHRHDFAFKANVQGNPFDVALSAEFTGPSGVRLNVPGFYDGEGTWKVRFAPTELGRWSMTTASSVAALHGQSDTAINCTTNRHPQIHGKLMVDPAHPYHFLYQDGTRYFLLGYEADWLWGADPLDPQRKLMHTLINQMASRGFNHVLVNIFAFDTGWSPGRKHEWDFGPSEIFPWEGTNEKPDHSRLNPKFFQIYDRMMDALQEKGIVAHIMIKVYNKKVNWPAKHSADEKKYFRYVTARYQGYSNVVWDFAKESYNEKDEQLQYALIDYVRDLDAYKHLTTAHDDDLYTWTPSLNRNLDFRSDQQHTDWAEMIAFDRAIRAYPVVNTEFAYERGVDKMPTYRTEHDWQEQLHRAYLVYLAGGYGVYYYHNTAWDVFRPEPEAPGMKPFQLLASTLSSLPYWRMQPMNELAVGGPCLALPGDAYAFYVKGAHLTANLSGLENPAAAAAEWVNTWSGERAPAQLSGAQITRLKKPESFQNAPALLIVKSGAR